jgi:hypothetical protein
MIDMRDDRHVTQIVATGRFGLMKAELWHWQILGVGREQY